MTRRAIPTASQQRQVSKTEAVRGLLIGVVLIVLHVASLAIALTYF